MDHTIVIYVTDSCTYIETGGVPLDRDHPEGSRRLDAGHAKLPQEADELGELGAAIGAHIARHFPAAEKCSLVIPSTWSFLQILELPTSQFSERTVAYALEQNLPVNVEELTCGAVKLDRQRVLACGVYTAPLRLLLETLESHGLDVLSVTVDAALLFEDGLSSESVGILDEQRLVLWFGEDGDINGCIRSIAVPKQEQGELRRTWIERSFRRLWAAGSPVRLLDISSGAGEPIQGAKHISVSESVQRLCNTTFDGSDNLELRVGALAPTRIFERLRAPFLAACGALAVLFVCMALSARFEAGRYARANAELRAAKKQIIQHALPGASTTAGASLRLRSEVVRLQGLTTDGAGAIAGTVSNSLELLTRMRDAVARIPDDVRVKINEFIVDEDRLTLNGRTRTHNDAGRIVQQINDVETLAAAPPRTKLRDDKTVDFRISATWGAREAD